jgi:hypothetical protein
MKKKVAILQLEIFKSLYSVFNSEEAQALLEQLRNDPEKSKDKHLQYVFDSIDEIKEIYQAVNKMPKCAPVHLSVVGIMFDRMQTVMHGITRFSEEARGDPGV